MKKKILIIGIIIFIIVIGIVFIVRRNSNFDNNIILSEFYSQNTENVDDGVESFIESESFKNMSENNQIKEIYNLLKIYEKNSVIKNLNYDDENKFFSYIYNYGEIKGAEGGVSLKKNSMMN